MRLYRDQKKMAKRMLIIFVMLMSANLHAKEWAFDVYLDDKKIGAHTFTLDNNTLTSQADFLVKILFINAYEYHHSAVEQWDQHCLASLTADTTENSDAFKVRGFQKDNAFQVEYKQNTQQLPLCTMTFAYWNPEILKQTQLLNPQNAEYMDVSITPLADEAISVKGALIETKHYGILGALKGEQKLNIEVWYDHDDDWVRLKSTTPEGYEIVYRLKDE